MTFDDFCQEWIAPPFEWGRTDCVQFPFAWVRHVSGVDHTLGYTYDSEQGAAAIIAEAGGLEALVSRHLGPINRDRRTVSQGDVILSAFDRGPTLGLAAGPRSFLMRTPRGLVPVQMELAIGSWSCHKQ